MHTRRLMFVATAAAVGAALVPPAHGAARQSVYTVTQITQTSHLKTSSVNVKAVSRYTARPGKNLVRFDFPAKGAIDRFTRGGKKPKSGVLDSVRARSASQVGRVKVGGKSCRLATGAPDASKRFNMRFYRASRKAKKVRVEVYGLTALDALNNAIVDGRTPCAQKHPGVSTLQPGLNRDDVYYVSFPVARKKLRRARVKGKSATINLRGTSRTKVSGAGENGTLTVITRVQMTLVRSR